MTAYKLAALALFAAVSLTSCAAPEPEHATVEDCVVWLAEALDSRGTDSSDLIKLGLLQSDCETKQAEMTVEEFDELYLSDPTP